MRPRLATWLRPAHGHGARAPVQCQSTRSNSLPLAQGVEDSIGRRRPVRGQPVRCGRPIPSAFSPASWMRAGAVSPSGAGSERGRGRNAPCRAGRMLGDDRSSGAVRGRPVRRRSVAARGARRSDAAGPLTESTAGAVSVSRSATATVEPANRADTRQLPRSTCTSPERLGGAEVGGHAGRRTLPEPRSIGSGRRTTRSCKPASTASSGRADHLARRVERERDAHGALRRTRKCVRATSLRRSRVRRSRRRTRPLPARRCAAPIRSAASDQRPTPCRRFVGVHRTGDGVDVRAERRPISCQTHSDGAHGSATAEDDAVAASG